MEDVNQTEKNLNKKDPILLAFICSTACFVMESITYPFETLKTKIQFEKDEFLSVRKGFQKFKKKEGIKTYFRGFSTVIPTGYISTFIWFYIYERCNEKQMNMIKHRSNETYLKALFPFISGCLAELGAIFIHLPFDIVRVRMQVGEYRYKNVQDCIYQIYKNEGFKRFYNSGHIYLLTSMFSSGYFFFIYENFRCKYLEYKDNNENSLNFKETFGLTIISSLFSSICLNPLDVLLTRFQMLDSRKYKLSIVSVLRNLIKHEGISAVFKGLNSRLLISIIYNLMFLEVYEFYRVKYGILLF